MTLGELREEVWNALARYDLALHPTPPHGHHPNFLGARRAAERLLKTPEFQGARRVLAGMDAVLKPLREEALRQGKELLLPHPDRPGEFLLLKDLDPRKLKRVREAYRFGVRVALEEAPPDLVLIGAVAVDEEGGWVGKGYGFPQSWLQVEAPFATLAHPVMVYPRLPVPPERRVDLIATPQRLLRLG
ncbi:5-formyltetrahydrofolate cyclo-ligase [Thermus thermophilus]|uniref:5-formyltetrahydrofolate cyclo-ligase n=1 Tax=Thermus thermophilus TaxID=274 RepID=UPI0013FD159B|nr:5-formyltetrahydrofolate cyclo-ligase [Thermus thermophilus]